MTLPTFVAATQGGDDTSAANISVTRAGTAAAGRVRIVALYRETNAAVTATGWTQIGETVNTGSPNMYVTFFWHRDDGSAPASWTFSWSGSTWRGYVSAAYDDVVAAGDPTEQYTGGSGSSSTITGPTITTQGDDRLRMFGGIFFYGSASSFGNPSVGTRRGNINALAFLADENRATAGATGTVTIQPNNAETGRWAAACFGLIGATADSSVTVTPAALGSEWAINAPTISTGSSVTVQPSALASVWAFNAPTVTAGQGVTVNLNGGYALRFFGNDEGNGTTNIDRVRIPRENPLGTDTPADVGAGDFTIEFRFRCAYANNASVSIPDSRYSNNLWDADIWGDDRGWTFGVTRVGGTLVTCLGCAGDTPAWNTDLGATDVGDNQWRWAAITWDQSTRTLSHAVEGVFQGSLVLNSGVTNLEYPDGVEGDSPNGSDHFWVIGAEKHDADRTTYLSFNGEVTEVRISNTLRYASDYTPATAPFGDDANTMVLLHFDEGTGTTLDNAASVANAALADGLILRGGTNSGPAWVVSSDPIHVSGGLAIEWAINAPSVSAGGAVTLTPASLASEWAITAPTVVAAQSVTVQPAALGVELALAAPAVVAAQAVTVTPATLGVEIGLTAPTIVAAQAVTVTPASLAAEWTLTTPAIQVGGAVTVQPASLAAEWVINAPTVVAAQAATVTPAAIEAELSLPAPTVSAGSGLTVTPAALGSEWAINAPTISTGSSVTVSPAALGLVWNIAAPAVTAAQAVTVNVSALAMTVAILTPGISVNNLVGATTLTVNPRSISVGLRSRTFTVTPRE